MEWAVTAVMQLVIEPRGTLSRFYHLWLRHVRGFIDGGGDCHCIRCLVATRDRRVSAKDAGPRRIDLAAELTPAVPGDPVYYLCGVSPAGWSSNLHVPFTHDRDGVIDVRAYDGTRVLIEGARALPIAEVPDGFEGRPASQTRCRNWRFAREWFSPARG